MKLLRKRTFIIKSGNCYSVLLFVEIFQLLLQTLNDESALFPDNLTYQVKSSRKRTFIISCYYCAGVGLTLLGVKEGTLLFCYLLSWRDK